MAAKGVQVKHYLLNKQALLVMGASMGFIIGLASCAPQHSAMNGEASKQASVIIDAQHIIGEQSPLFFGGNNIYPKGGQGLLLESGEFNPETIALSSELGLTTYRFPGGSEGNLYKWKRGIGPLSERIDNVSGNNRGPQSNEFGSDEFGRLLETTNFKHGFMMVAYGYEKPDDAADWVEYMNSPVGANPNGGKDWAKVRAENGHPEPYNIKYWEIGNEVYGNWELNWGSYPDKFDAKRGTGNAPVDNVAGKAGTLPFGDADRYIHGGYRYFEQQKAASVSSWQDQHIKTNGQANQQLFVKFPPVDLSQNDLPFILKVGDEEWQKVTDFSLSKANSKHYVLETETGQIIFGNGQNGLIPPSGEFVFVNYRSGKQPGFIEYYQKMKAVDPSIVVLSCFEKESFYQGMAEVNSPFDGVVKHYYPSTHKNVSESKKYEAQIARGMGIERPIKEHNHWLKQFKNSAISGTEKLWITEYGLRGHVNQVATMHTVIGKKSQEVAALLGHSLFLNNNTPMVTDDGVIRARALPIPMFSKHSEQYVVQSEVKVAPTRLGKQLLPGVLTTAAVDAKKQHVSVVLTNTNGQQAVDTTVRFENLQVAQNTQLEVWILRSNTSNPIDDNRIGQLNNVSLTLLETRPFKSELSIQLPAASSVVIKSKVTSDKAL
ncbi:hypothetical protein [Paraglaciecola sp. L3A3]|uniref:hypothetical protein n=1 Tax=Paraglaciecola sp. L3A3 TaxID=2686358 RepID=UPI001E386AA6|nr:hypothetical protein [Paraglaciecola sp. L3A3]